VIKLERVFAVSLCLIPLSLAAAPVPGAAAGRSVYIVQLEGAPLARSAAAAASAEGPRKLDLAGADSLRALETLRLRQDEALTAIGVSVGRTVEPLRRYTVAFNGLALELTDEEAAALAKRPGIRQVRPSARYHVSSDAGPAWTGAPGLWDGTATGGLPGTQGEGMVIGVIDTGIIPGHSAFADVGGDGYDHVNPRGAGNYAGWCSPSNPDYDPTLACNDKLIGAWSFEDGGDPRDDNGHGSHTASIAAGNRQTITVPGTSLTRTISGVAPHANLISYDACDSSGYCNSYLLLAAVDQAVADGVDVLNLSIATYGYSPWYDSLGVALLEARAAGIFATAALDWSEIGSPGNAPWVLAVGASTHDRRFTSSLVATAGGVLPLPSLPGQSLTTSYGPAEIVLGNDYGSYDCSSPFAPGTFGGKIVVCGHYYYDSEIAKGQNVLAGGAGGLVLLNAYSDMPLSTPAANVLPWIHLPWGSTLWDWLSNGSGHTARITATAVDIQSIYGDRLWPDSPSGPPDYNDTPNVLKPDVAAPGQDILAADTSPGGYGVRSGTSMAAAHAAGAAALLMSLHPGWTPAEIQSALQMSGTGVTRVDGTPAEPFEIGGGRLNLGPAARAGLVLPVTIPDFEAADPWKDGDPKTLNLPGLVDQRCVQSCGWTRTVKSTLATTSTWTVSVEAPGGVNLNVTPSSFTLGPGGTQTLQITASGPVTLTGWRFGRVILTENAAQAPAAHLPVATYWVPHYPLTVQKSGSGAGTVTSNPAGIDCGSDCSELFREDLYVTLTATPAPGSVFAGWSGGYCDGAWPTCSVPMYGSRLETAYFNLPYPDRALTNQVPLKDSIRGPVYGGTWRYYSVDLGSGNSELVVDLFDLTGDASLLVRSGQKPTVEYDADCIDDYSSYGTYNRRCVISNPVAGRWWIGVNNQEENVNILYSVRASWGNVTDRELANRSPVAGFLSSSSPGAAWKYYYMDVPAGSTDLAVELSLLSADADLYVRYGAKPDRANNDCASSEGSTVPDHCEFPSPAGGRWWIGVNNFSAGTINYSVKARWRTVDTPSDVYAIPPCRVLDTRITAQPLVSGVPRSIPIAGQCGIPASAKAVAVNVTVVSPTSAGALVLYPADEGEPLTAALSFGNGQLRSNNAFLKLATDGTGTLAAVANLGVGQVHLVVDVSGYSQ
jgi:subtilisin family serine protease